MIKQQSKQSDSSEELDSSDYEDTFKPPAKDENNLFDKYKNSRVIDEQDSDVQDGPYTIKNLDTGQIYEIHNEQEYKVLDFQISYKRRQLKMIQKKSMWLNFWKSVHNNNQFLRAYAEKGQFQNLRSILLFGKNGYPVQINSRGLDDWTALHFAAFEDHYQIVRFLLENDAKVNALTKFGRSALHISTMRGHFNTVIILCQFKIRVQQQDEDGNTALHYAVQNSQIQILQYLLKISKKLKINKSGKTPLDLAQDVNTRKIFHQFGFITEYQGQDESQYNYFNKPDIKSDFNHKIENKVNMTKLLSQQTLSPNSFIFYRQLGKGSFGEVFLVQKKNQDKLYAMKVLNKQLIFGKNLVRYALAERNVLSGMDHPFIVKLNFAFQTETKLFLVMDYCPGGDLGKLLAKRKLLPEIEVKYYISQLVLAFEALHKKFIVFRDLKPDNVVLDSEGHARLTDFGLSKQGVYNNTTQSFCGSLAYLAPQVLNKQGHSRTVDWYLLGLLIYELIVGIPPYYNIKKQVLFENIKRGPLKIPKHMSNNAKDLIKKLLCRDPKKRLGSAKDSEEIKQHPFFEGINWIEVLQRKLPVTPIQIPKINLNDTLKVNFYDKPNENVKRIEDWTFINGV